MTTQKYFDKHQLEGSINWVCTGVEIVWKRYVMEKTLGIEKNDAPNYCKISNDTNKDYVDIMNTKSDLSESEYTSVSKMRYLSSEYTNASN